MGILGYVCGNAAWEVTHSFSAIYRGYDGVMTPFVTSITRQKPCLDAVF